MKHLQKTTTLLLSLLMLVSLPACTASESTEQVIYEIESPYHHIQVVKRAQGNMLDMRFGKLTQSTMQNNDPAFSVSPYMQSAFMGLTMTPEPKRALFIGMGAGIMVNVLRKHFPQLKIDVVDIDPAVVEVAKSYFHFTPDERTKVIVEDGRIFLRHTDKRYDLIFLDAFNSEEVPFHLTTLEFLSSVKSKLTDQGCLVSHYWGSNWNKLFAANVRTHQELFANVYVLNARQTGDFILLAPSQTESFSKETIVKKAKQLMLQPFHFDLEKIAMQEFIGPASIDNTATVLTDDYAPVNLLRHQTLD